MPKKKKISFRETRNMNLGEKIKELQLLSQQIKDLTNEGEKTEVIKLLSERANQLLQSISDKSLVFKDIQDFSFLIRQSLIDSDVILGKLGELLVNKGRDFVRGQKDKDLTPKMVALLRETFDCKSVLKAIKHKEKKREKQGLPIFVAS